MDDEEVDVALKLAQCDIYERKLREQVRRKRVARDYQLVGKFYTENPIIEIGGGKKFAPLRITNTMRETKKSDGPKQELIESLKPLTQYNTAQEYYQLINNLCVEKELKVRVKELHKYRENGLTKVDQLCEFESARFKHQLKLKRWAKAAAASATPGGPSQQAATNAK